MAVKGPPEARTVVPETIWIVVHGSRIQVAGSACLLLAAVTLHAVRSSTFYWVFVGFAGYTAFTGVGTMLHFLSWGAYREASARHTRLRPAFYASIAGLVGGIAVSLVLGVVWGYPAVNAPVLLCASVFLVLPYNPIAWAPLAAAHGAFFLQLGRDLRLPGAAPLVHAGAVALVVLAGTGVAALLFLGLEPSVMLLSGLSVSAYGLVALGLHREYERTRMPLVPPPLRSV